MTFLVLFSWDPVGNRGDPTAIPNGSNWHISLHRFSFDPSSGQAAALLIRT